MNLKDYGLIELSNISNVDGGIGVVLAFVLGACAGGLIWDICGNPSETAAAWNEGRGLAFSNK